MFNNYIAIYFQYPKNKNNVRMKEELIKDILNYFDVSIEQFNSSSRRENIVMARYVYIYLQHLNGRKIMEISRGLGIPHSTIGNAIKKIENEIDTNDEINDFITILYRKYV